MNNSYELIRFARTRGMLLERNAWTKKIPTAIPSSIKMTTNTKENATLWLFKV
jgi:hypothetical protein